MAAPSTQEATEDLYDLLTGICPKFKNIPESEKAVMSHYMAGVSVDAIAEITSRTGKSVREAIDRYQSLVSRVPDHIRMELSIKIMTGSFSTYAAVISDKTKIGKLTPVEALKCALDLPKVLAAIMDIRIKALEHDKKAAALNYTDFAATLGEAK